MKKLTETERAVKLAQAQAAISEYFRYSNNYSALLETSAEASAFLMDTMNEIANNDHKGLDENFSMVNSLVNDHIELIRLLKPFAELEGQVYGNSND